MGSFFSSILTSASGFNWWMLAAKAAAALLLAGGIFFAGYHYGSNSCVGAIANQVATATAAQKAQDDKQHAQAVAVSATAKAADAKQVAAAQVVIKTIHDKQTVIVAVPGKCPTDPQIDPDVLNAYNQAGH